MLEHRHDLFEREGRRAPGDDEALRSRAPLDHEMGLHLLDPALPTRSRWRLW